MHVHLHHPVIAHHQHRISHGGDLLSDRLHVQVIALDDELGIIVILTLRSKDLFWLHLSWRYTHNRLSPRLAEHALQNQHIPLSASIYHARFGQHRQQARRACQRRLRFGHCAGKHPLYIISRQCCPARRLCAFPGHRQDGAFDGPHDPLVGGDCALLKRLCKIQATKAVLTLQHTSKASQDLRENDPRVAPGSHQSPPCHHASQL